MPDRKGMRIRKAVAVVMNPAGAGKILGTPSAPGLRTLALFLWAMHVARKGIRGKNLLEHFNIEKG
ncbi:hypothetical protein, partial [Megalodesulfovibrio gigas]|uniref:hypothetical protein n=1 Tax=Megalodesulfovibrio gigas TaxID=879 RepID=UPI001F284080